MACTTIVISHGETSALERLQKQIPLPLLQFRVRVKGGRPRERGGCRQGT